MSGCTGRYTSAQVESLKAQFISYAETSGNVHHGNSVTWAAEATGLADTAGVLRTSGQNDAASKFDDAARLALINKTEADKAYNAAVETATAVKKL